MNGNNILKNVIMTVLAILTFGYLTFNFIYGNRKLILIMMVIAGIVGAIYSTLKSIIIIKNSENPQCVYESKLALTKVIIGITIIIITTVISIVFFI